MGGGHGPRSSSPCRRRDDRAVSGSCRRRPSGRRGRGRRAHGSERRREDFSAPGLRRAAAGDERVGGRFSATTWSTIPGAARREVAMLGHAAALYDDLSVAENVRFAVRAAGADVARVGGALERLGLVGRLRTDVGRAAVGGAEKASRSGGAGRAQSPDLVARRAARARSTPPRAESSTRSSSEAVVRRCDGARWPRTRSDVSMAIAERDGLHRQEAGSSPTL